MNRFYMTLPSKPIIGVNNRYRSLGNSSSMV